MASRAILRRRAVPNNLNSSTHFPQSFQVVGHVSKDLDARSSTTPNGSCLSPIEYGNQPSVAKEELLYFSGMRQFRQTCSRESISRIWIGQLEIISPTRIQWMSLTIRNATTAAAKHPEFGSDDENKDEFVAKKRKEASPEECDQAVEGLTSAKAKAKAKRAQESGDFAKLGRVWSAFLGVGPALRAVASMSREDWAKKLVHWKGEFVSTLQHYWLGFKLLWADMRISSRLLLKLAGGKNLSRRERQQLTRTTADMFRLLPFAVFIIVPFMEFLLPVFLKLFPNMLPSTFQDKMTEQEALKRKLNARIVYAKFLQDTAREMAREVQNSRSGEIRKTAEDLDEFLNRLRKGARVANEEILSFAKLFNDELTLDNINRPRLVNMCKYMGISPFGTDTYLRYMLRKRLQWIKEDDKLIRAEGIEFLSEAELREDCRERGMLGLLAVEEMRQQESEDDGKCLIELQLKIINELVLQVIQLRDWLDLSLNHSVPSSLLILSRAFTVSGKLKPEEAVQATLSSLPDEVVDTVGITALPSEDSVSERRRKLEFLEMQEELIKEEEEKEQEEQARMKEFKSSQEDVALNEMITPTARDAQEQARLRAVDKQEQLCELSRALAVLASTSSVSREREEFLKVVNKEIELYNSMIEKDSSFGEKEAMKAYRAAREEGDHSSEVAEGDDVSSALAEKVDSLLQNLEKEIDDVDAKIGDRWQLLDRDFDGKVSPEEVAAAAMCLKDTIGKDGIEELISNLSKDKDGKILVEDIVRLGSQSDDANTIENRGS